MSGEFCCLDCLRYLTSLTTCPYCGSRNTVPTSEADGLTLRDSEVARESCVTRREDTDEEDGPEACDACGGSGLCMACNGQGYIPHTCETCGHEEEDECSECEGSGCCYACEGTGTTQD